MAIDFIAVDTTVSTATHARKLLQYRDALRTAYELGKEVKAIMDHMQDGTIWTTIETKFGIATGLGDDVYNLVNGSVGAMEGSFQNDDCKQLTEQVGG